MELKGRVALVTGGAVRVGRAVALALAGRGASLGITYLSSAAEAEETVARIRETGASACAVRCDQRDPEQVSAAVRSVEDAFGPVAVLVNNAAVFRRTPFPEASLEEWDDHLDTNLRGPWLFAQALGPAMRARGAGVIINMLDAAVERPYPAYLPYICSKAGLAALTKGLARTLAPEVRVNGVAIGTVLWQNSYPEAAREAETAKIPLRHIGCPDDVAATVVFLIEGSEFLTGAIVPVDGGRQLT